MHEYILTIFTLINLPIIFFYNSITKFINIYDKADNIRKFHKNKVALSGGILIIYNLIFFFILDFLFFNHELLNLKLDTREFFSLILGLVLFFIIGIYDDKFNLSANKKLFLNFFVLIILILIDEKLIIGELNFSFSSHSVELRNFSFMFTILCILLFMNALNMFDGINLQVGSYCLIIFLIFFFKNLYIQVTIISLLTIFLFLFYNYKNKAFLGDNGTQILAFLISYILIKSYKFENAFTPEEIFIILAIPGFDMFRLFLQRLVKGRNPFSADRNHIHHILFFRKKEKYVFIFIQILIIICISLYYIFENKVIPLILTILFYLCLIILSQKKRKNFE